KPVDDQPANPALDRPPARPPEPPRPLAVALSPRYSASRRPPRVAVEDDRDAADRLYRRLRLRRVRLSESVEQAHGRPSHFEDFLFLPLQEVVDLVGVVVGELL